MRRLVLDCRRRGAVFAWPRNDPVGAGSRDGSGPLQAMACTQLKCESCPDPHWFPISPAPGAGILYPLLGSSCPGTRYLYAIADLCLDKIAQSTIFCPVSLILAVGPPHRLGGPPTLILTRARVLTKANNEKQRRTMEDNNRHQRAVPPLTQNG